MPLSKMVTMTTQVEADLYEAALNAARDHTPPFSIQAWVALAMREKLERDAG